MTHTIPLTDDEVRRLRQMLVAVCDYPDMVLTTEGRRTARAFMAKLPPERIDPRTLPPGPELDELACEAMGHPWPWCDQKVSKRQPYEHYRWSSPEENGGVGQMLDWLKKQGHERFFNDEGNKVRVQLFDSNLKVVVAHGETPQHALAIACAVVGQSDG